MRAALQGEECLGIPAWSVVQFDRCSGGNDVRDWRGTGEESERGENAGDDRGWERLKHSDHAYGGRRSWGLRQGYGDVGSGAERTVRVRDIPHWVGMNDLDRPGRNNQKHTKQSEEKPPRTLHIRSWPGAQHDESNISQDVTRM